MGTYMIHESWGTLHYNYLTVCWKQWYIELWPLLPAVMMCGPSCSVTPRSGNSWFWGSKITASTLCKTRLRLPFMFLILVWSFLTSKEEFCYLFYRLPHERHKIIEWVEWMIQTDYARIFYLRVEWIINTNSIRIYFDKYWPQTPGWPCWPSAPLRPTRTQFDLAPHWKYNNTRYISISPPLKIQKHMLHLDLAPH